MININKGFDLLLEEYCVESAVFSDETIKNFYDECGKLRDKAIEQLKEFITQVENFFKNNYFDQFESMRKFDLVALKYNQLAVIINNKIAGKRVPEIQNAIQLLKKLFNTIKPIADKINSNDADSYKDEKDSVFSMLMLTDEAIKYLNNFNQLFFVCPNPKLNSGAVRDIFLKDFNKFLNPLDQRLRGIKEICRKYLNK